MSDSFIRWFEDITLRDVPFVGGKNASLGELYRELRSAGVHVPNGFAITADGYRHFLGSSGLDGQIADRVRGLQTGDLAALAACGLAIRQQIVSSEMPADLQDQIVTAYEQLGDGLPIDVAVRSSATAEDLPDASFAGQQETYLNVRGRAALLDACRRSFASLFTDRAISYRADKGFDQLQIALSIGVQRMVRADLATSGVMFTLDTETGFRDVVLINASYGLGEPIVQGSVTPDEYLRLQADAQAGIQADPAEDPRAPRSSSSSTTRAAAAASRPCRWRRPIARALRARPTSEILTLGPLGVRDRRPLQPRPRHAHADGHRVGQGRPHRRAVHRPGAARKPCMRAAEVHALEQYRLRERGRVLVTGRSIGGKIAAGPVRVIPNAVGSSVNSSQGEVLVTDKTDPDWEPIMKKSRRDRDQPRRAHVSRGDRQPRARRAGHRRHRNRHRGARDGQLVTVSCAEGDDRFRLRGGAAPSTSSTSICRALRAAATRRS